MENTVDAMTHRSGLTRADAAMPVGTGRQVEVVVRVGLAALLGVLLITASVLLLRRVLGALVAPLPSAALAMAGIALAAMGGLVRIASCRIPRQGRARGWRWPVQILTSLAVLAVAYSVSVSGSGWLGLASLWGAVVVGEVFSWHPFHMLQLRWPLGLPPLSTLQWLPRLSIRSRLPIKSRLPTRIDPPHRPEPHGVKAAVLEPTAIIAAEVLQQLTRRQLADGVEELAGWVRVSFAPGQRTENVHVAFCPPFAAAPQLTVAQLDGPPARTKTAQLLPYGVRIDLKLSGPAEANTSVLLEFSARHAGT